MINLKSYTALIETELTAINFPEKPNNLYDPLRYFLTIGGKRIRPILTLLGAELFGTDKLEAMPQALSIEVFHNFTLIHDDIMDRAPLRRNKETVHEKWNTDIAILSGDVLMIKSYQLLGQIDPKLLPEAFELFNKTAIEVCEGQQMDMDFETREDVTVHEYMEMIRLKTSVLLGAALNLGAVVAQANKADKESLRLFGENIGIAFQIQDDLLDLYGDPEKFGKQIGGDVISNKKTILHLTAISSATKDQIDILQQLQREPNPTVKINRTKELYNHLMVKEACAERMNTHYQIALSALDKIQVPSKEKETLIALAKFLINREL